MRRLRLILDSARKRSDQGHEGALATVVKVEGSISRRPGRRRDRPGPLHRRDAARAGVPS